MNDRTDEQLILDCLQANQNAWNALIRRYRQLVSSVIRSYHLPDSDGADIFQSVWLDVFNSLSSLRETKALAGWLITVTNRKCLRWKQTARHGDETVVDLELLPDANAPERFAVLERQQLLRL